MAERLDMLPLNKRIGFIKMPTVSSGASQGTIVRKILARALADKIEIGQYTQYQVLSAPQETILNSDR